jgi:tetratricopeptide (TPR) repeat protein
MSVESSNIATYSFETVKMFGMEIRWDNEVMPVTFSSDGKTILTGSRDETARLWETPARLPDDVPRLAAWVQTLTGLELDEQGVVHALDSAAWRQRRELLSRLGGPPPADTGLLLDPILFGPDPTARARAWVKRERWVEAEAAFDEAVRARPLNSAVWEERILALMAAGARDGLRKVASDLLKRFRETTDPSSANWVARSCVLASGAVADCDAPVKLAEIALKGSPSDEKPYVLNTLGAALYRAGRFEDAIRRLEEGIRLRNGMEIPLDRPFLAMAHLQLGHRDEARRWLDRIRNRQPSTDPDQFWAELELRLLRSEAEAVILYDPIFPADPFAH